MIHLALLARRPNLRVQPAVTIDGGLQEGHSEGTTVLPNCVPKALRIEIVEHKLDPFGMATFKPWKHLVDLLSLQSDEDQVIWDRLVQGLGYEHIRSQTLDINDGIIPVQVQQTIGSRSCDRCHLVTTLASQLKREGAPDAADTNDGDSQLR
jgi:hypothetical protein